MEAEPFFWGSGLSIVLLPLRLLIIIMSSSSPVVLMIVGTLVSSNDDAANKASLFGRRSRFSATSWIIWRLIIDSPAEYAASIALSQILLICRGIPSEHLKMKSTAPGVKILGWSEPAISSLSVM